MCAASSGMVTAKSPEPKSLVLWHGEEQGHRDPYTTDKVQQPGRSQSNSNLKEGQWQQLEEGKENKERRR